MLKSPPISRSVSKARLIAALMAELDACQAMVIAKCAASGKIFHKTIQCLFKIPFTDSEVIIETGIDSPTLLDCVCCYAGQRIAFFLRRKDDQVWYLPTEVSLIELRHDPRTAFAEKMYSAEIVSERHAVYGYAIDVNRDFLAVDIDASHNFSIGGSVKVILRLLNTNCDVFYSSCSIAQIKENAGSGFRIVLLLGGPQPNRTASRQYERRLVSSASIGFSDTPFVDKAGEIKLSIHNMSIGGMTVGTRDGSDYPPLIRGLILRSTDLGLSFLVVWVDQDRMGLRPLLSDPHHLGIWYRYIDQISPPQDRKTTVTRKELADLLTHSGLLKGSRRSHLGKAIAAHIISNPSSESPLLIQRCLVAGDDGVPELHVSSKRIAESTWFFGEGAALTERFGDYNSMLDACTRRMIWMAQHSHLHCRYLTGIWHYTVKSTASWGDAIGKNAGSSLLDAVQVSITDINSDCQKSGEFGPLREIRSLPASARRQLSLRFAADLYESLVGGDGSHPVLNSELGKLGPYHRVVTKVISGPEEAPLVAHRIITHNVWSSTGVTNSVFVLVPKGFRSNILCDGLSEIAKDEIAFGTDDFLVIFDGEAGSCSDYLPDLPSAKRFTFLIHDLYLNEDGRFFDVADEKRRRSEEGSDGSV